MQIHTSCIKCKKSTRASPEMGTEAGGASSRYCLTLWDSCLQWSLNVRNVSDKTGEGELPALGTAVSWGRAEHSLKCVDLSLVLLKISILGTCASPFCSVQLKVTKTVFPGLCSSSLFCWCWSKSLGMIKGICRTLKQGKWKNKLKLQYPLNTGLNSWGKSS